MLVNYYSQVLLSLSFEIVGMPFPFMFQKHAILSLCFFFSIWCCRSYINRSLWFAFCPVGLSWSARRKGGPRRKGRKGDLCLPACACLISRCCLICFSCAGLCRVCPCSVLCSRNTQMPNVRTQLFTGEGRRLRH